MPFCANCGFLTEAGTCPKCGSGVSLATPAATGSAGNVVSALCYLFLVVAGALFLAWPPYNRDPKIRFHACQSIFLGVAWVAIWFVFSAVSLAFHLAGIFFAARLFLVIGTTFLVFWVYMIANTYRGREIILPVIGTLAKQQV